MKATSSLIFGFLILFLFVNIANAQDSVESLQEKVKQHEQERKQNEQKGQTLVDDLRRKLDELLEKQDELLNQNDKKEQLDKVREEISTVYRLIKNLKQNNQNSVPLNKTENAVNPNTNNQQNLQSLDNNNQANVNGSATNNNQANVNGSATTNPPDSTQETPKDNLANLSEVVVDSVENSSQKPALDITSQSRLILPLVFSKTVKDEKLSEAVKDGALQDVEAARTDKLLGGNAQSTGTTSLVSKGGIPLIFSLATEYGAATSSVNGTSTTFHFNPVGLSDFLTGSRQLNNTDSPCKDAAGFRRIFCRTSFGLSFDISRGVETPTFTGSKEQLSQLSFRYEFLRKREPNELEFKAATDVLLNDTILGVSSAQLTALSALLSTDNLTFKSSVLQNWINETNAKLDSVQLQFAANGSAMDESVKKANIKKVKDVLAEQLTKFPVEEMKKDATVTAAITSFINADELYSKAKKEYLMKLMTKSIFTFEYVNNRELNSPDSSNFRFIYGKGLDNGIDFTVNGSFTAFHSRPAVSTMISAEDAAKFKRLRDFSFAAEIDIPLFGVPGLNDSTFSLAGKYQRMNTDAFVFNNMIFTDIKGDVWIGQGKLNLGLGKSGFFLPLSFTYSNRSELNKEKETRGHLGFTFDISPLIEKYLSGMFQR